MNTILRTIVLTLCALLLAPARGNAQSVSGYPIGYCNGEVTTNAIVKFDDRDTDISGAIYIPASYAATVQGNRIEAVRVGLGAQFNVSNVRVWVRSTLDGVDLGSGSLPDDDMERGWNDVALTSPVELTPELCEQGFYLGYTFHQRRKSAGLAAISEPHDGAMWVKAGEGEWLNRSEEGTLCIEGLVYGDLLPRCNVQLVSVATDPFYVISFGSINCVATVRNIATETVTDLDIEARFEGVDTPAKVRVDCDIPFGATSKISFTLAPGIASSNPSKVTATFTVTGVNGQADEDSSDNTASASFQVLERAFQRKAVIEEFTTERCPNCPRVAEYLHEILSDNIYALNAEAICHHAGYYTDPLTTDFDEEYTWFYGDHGTYAPAVMVDRHIANPADDYSPLFCPGSKEELEAALVARLELPSAVRVAPEAWYTAADDSMKVIVECQRSGADAFDGGYLTVFVVEDNVPSISQAGAGTGYMHQHVNRAVNEVWGAPVEWEGDYAHYHCAFAINPSWKRPDLKIVAFISRDNGTDRTESTIENAGSSKIYYSGIEETVSTAGDHTVKAIYNSAGVAIPAPVHGLNIILFSDGTTQKVYLR